MKETIIAILPGITIYAATFIATRFILTLLWKMARGQAQFFKDEAGGRRLARDAGYRLTISASDEPRVYARLTRTVTLLTWLRYLSVCTALVFVAGTATIMVSPPVAAEEYRYLVFIASAVHGLSVTISYVLVRTNEQLVLTASDRREY